EWRGRSSQERQGPAFRARPTDNRAGLAKSRPCAFRRAIPLIRGEGKERKTGGTPRPSKQTRASIALAKRLFDNRIDHQVPPRAMASELSYALYPPLILRSARNVEAAQFEDHASCARVSKDGGGPWFETHRGAAKCAEGSASVGAAMLLTM